MIQRKKFLYIGLLLNLLFFFGISLYISMVGLQDRRWFMQAALAELTKVQRLLLEEDERKLADFVHEFYQHRWSPSEIKTIAAYPQIIAVHKWQNDNANVIFSLKDNSLPDMRPVIKLLKEQKNTAIYHQPSEDYILISYLLAPDRYPQLNAPHVVTVKRSLTPPTPLAVYQLKSDVSVLQKKNNQTEVLYSTLEKEIQEDLVKKFVFIGAPYENDAEWVELAQNDYVLLPIRLLTDENLTQSLVFSFKLIDFALFDNAAAAMFIIFLFCVALAATFLAYTWSGKSD